MLAEFPLFGQQTCIQHLLCAKHPLWGVERHRTPPPKELVPHREAINKQRRQKEGMHARSVTQSCPALCDRIDCSPPGSSVCRIFQAGSTLEWVAISSSRGSSRLRDWTRVSCVGRWILYPWEAGRESVLTKGTSLERKSSDILCFARGHTATSQVPKPSASNSRHHQIGAVYGAFANLLDVLGALLAVLALSIFLSTPARGRVTVPILQMRKTRRLSC